MRRGRGLAVMLMAGLLVGCSANETVRSTSWLSRLRPLQGPPAANAVLVEVALIERPVGDPYLNRQLWELADEQSVPLERKAIIQDNGFRVGLIGGMPPAELQALLTSERSCANPRRIQRLSGDPTTLLLGLTRPRCQFKLQQDGSPQLVALEQAECALIVTPTLAADGRTRLQFTPQVRHGETALVPRPAQDRSGTYSWMLQEQRPTETYSAMGWEVTLAANEFLVVGGRFDRPQSLGHCFFVRADEPSPVQRLLVVRVARLRPGIAAEDEELLHQAPALAAQAALTGNPPP